MRAIGGRVEIDGDLSGQQDWGVTETNEPLEIPPLFVADESIFRCEVTRPDPSSSRSMTKTQGAVTARLADGASDKAVGSLDFFMKDGQLATIRYRTDPEHRRKGCAREMTKALRREYMGTPLVSSPARPTAEGHGTLVRLHDEGLIDELRFDLSAGVEDSETGE